MRLFEIELDTLQFTHPIQISIAGSMFLKIEVDFINVEKQRRSTVEIIVDISSGFYPTLPIQTLTCSSLSSLERFVCFYLIDCSNEILGSLLKQNLPSYRLLAFLCQKLREIL